MDKRISKTKRNLKNTLRRLLRRKPLSSITVTELCKDAETSRITFYAHYNDKYDLANEMVRDIALNAGEHFSQLQRTDNPEGDTRKTVENIVDAILDGYEHNTELMSSLSPKDSVYLKNVLYNQIVIAITQQLGELLPRLSDGTRRRFALFACAGLNEYINECRKQSVDSAHIRQGCKLLSVSMYQSFDSMIADTSEENLP